MMSDLCSSAITQLANKFARDRVPSASAAHREWILLFDVLTSRLSPWCWRTIYTLAKMLMTDHNYITTWMTQISSGIKLSRWRSVHGIRIRNVEVDKAVVLCVEKWSPDGVSHAHYDTYLKITSLVSADQGKSKLQPWLQMEQQAGAFCKRSAGIKKRFLIQKEVSFKALLRFAMWNIYLFTSWFWHWFL